VLEKDQPTIDGLPKGEDLVKVNPENCKEMVKLRF
jgi:hypothetical protein